MSVDPAKLAAHYGLIHKNTPPWHLGTRYDAAGNFLPEPGNTVVCHLVSGSATERALASARARYQAMPDAGKLAFTPVNSYHMTLFQGIIEGRRKLPYWPSDMAPDAPIEAMTAHYLKRLSGFKPAAPFAVELIEALPTGLIVAGATAADRHEMGEWRNRFAEAFGYRHPDHDSYEFHITMAYMIDWLDDAAIPAWTAMLNDVAAEIRAAAPVPELRAPAFCSFADMNWFEQRMVFGGD